MGDFTDLFELRNFDEKVFVMHADREACMNFVGHAAQEDNYGVYRTWNEDGWYYYDCGPRTFCSQLKLEPTP